MRFLKWEAAGLGQYVLGFEEFVGQDIPRYAILSHTWADDEVLYVHVTAGTAAAHQGYTKVQSAVRQADKDGFSYIWIDTCCIDKSSSAELSEAVNSMFAWYQNAKVCYAYLSDVNTSPDAEAVSSQFQNSRWFTRGWCLQELIAPENLMFFSSAWDAIGDKKSQAIKISRITGINPRVLADIEYLQLMSVAQKMSWAAGRQTTRPEDIAYCLMGVFSVNMPLLYGEGTKAFQRLQEAIMMQSDDHSLFAWMNPAAKDHDEHGLLADSPEWFALGSTFVPYQDWEQRNTYQVTNRGLRIDLHLQRVDSQFIMQDRGDTFAAALDCPAPDREFTGYIGIVVHEVRGREAQQYKRVECSRLLTLPERGELQKMYVSQNPPVSVRNAVYPIHYFHIGSPWFRKDYEVLDVQADTTGVLDIATTFRENPWIPSPFPTVYKIHKIADRLSAAILVKRLSDGFQFAFLLGSYTALEVGFDVLLWPEVKLEALDQMEQKFDPQPQETTKYLDSFELTMVTQCYAEKNEKRYEVIMYLAADAYSEESSDDEGVVSAKNYLGEQENGRVSGAVEPELTDGPPRKRSKPEYSTEKTWLARPIPKKKMARLLGD